MQKDFDKWDNVLYCHFVMKTTQSKPEQSAVPDRIHFRLDAGAQRGFAILQARNPMARASKLVNFALAHFDPARKGGK